MKQKILKWKIEQRHESGYDVTANGSVRIAFVKEQQMKYVIRKKNGRFFILILRFIFTEMLEFTDVPDW